MKKNKADYLFLTLSLLSTALTITEASGRTYKEEVNGYLYNLKSILSKQDETYDNKIKFSYDMLSDCEFDGYLAQKPKFEYLKQFKNDESLFDNNIHLMINNYRRNTNISFFYNNGNNIIFNLESKYKLSDNKKVSLGFYTGAQLLEYSLSRYDIPAGIFIKGYHDYEKIKLNYGAMGYGIYQNSARSSEYKALGLGFAGAEYQVNDKFSVEGHSIIGFGISQYSEFNTNDRTVTLGNQPTAYSLPLYLELKTNYSLRDGIKIHAGYGIDFNELLRDSFREIVKKDLLHIVSFGITVDF